MKKQKPLFFHSNMSFAKLLYKEKETKYFADFLNFIV